MRQRLGQFVYVPPPALISQGVVPPTATPNWATTADPGIYEQNGQAVYVADTQTPSLSDQFSNILYNVASFDSSIGNAGSGFNFLFYAGVGIILVSLIASD